MTTTPGPVESMPCKQCQQRLGCEVKDCGRQDCPCRQVCVQCAADIQRAVRRRWGEKVRQRGLW